MDKTSRLGLNLPDKGFRDWDVPINENFSLLDAADGQNVKVSGNQTINDIKVFTNSILRRISNLDVTTTPATTQYLDWLSPQDKNGVSVGYFGTVHRNNGLLTSRLGVTRFIDGVGKYQDISVSIAEDGTIFTQAPTPATNDSSTQIATTANVDAKITAQAVKLTGNQTVAGSKVFTSNLTIKDTKNALSENASTNTYTDVVIQDKNNVPLAIWEYRHLTGNGSGISMVLRKRGSESNAVWARIGIFQDTSGNFYTETITPATADNSTKIASTAFVKAQIQEVTAAPSSPVSGVLYVIPE